MSAQPEFGKLVVFGVGLIGGSFSLALQAAGQVEEVVGFGRSLASLTQAMDLGIIDRVGANPGQEVSDADLVLIATPVAQMPEIMARIAPYLGAQTIVTDGGSTRKTSSQRRENILVTGFASLCQGIRLPVPRTADRLQRVRVCIGKESGVDTVAGKYGVERGALAFCLGVVWRPGA